MWKSEPDCFLITSKIALGHLNLRKAQRIIWVAVLRLLENILCNYSRRWFFYTGKHGQIDPNVGIIGSQTPGYEREIPPGQTQWYLLQFTPLQQTLIYWSDQLGFSLVQMNLHSITVSKSLPCHFTVLHPRQRWAGFFSVFQPSSQVVQPPFQLPSCPMFCSRASSEVAAFSLMLWHPLQLWPSAPVLLSCPADPLLRCRDYGNFYWLEVNFIWIAVLWYYTSQNDFMSVF